MKRLDRFFEWMASRVAVCRRASRPGRALPRPRRRRRVRNSDRQARVRVPSTNERTNGWRKLDYALPPGTSIVDAQGRDAGLRFVDVDGDGYDDILFSNHERYSLHLFRKDDPQPATEAGLDGRNHFRQTRESRSPIRFRPSCATARTATTACGSRTDTMWIQNEDTAHLPDKVDRRTFKQLLSGSQPRAMSPEESLKAMRVRPGFKIELVASEPLIQSPVAFEWSADGRLWVVEMGDYPTASMAKESPADACACWKTRMAMAATTRQDVSRRVEFPDRHLSVAQRCRHQCGAGHFLRRGHEWRRQGRRREIFSRDSLEATNSIASTALITASMAGSTARMATAAGMCEGSVERRLTACPLTLTLSPLRGEGTRIVRH